MDWMPIETVPKDGRGMLLFGPDGRIGFGFIESDQMGDLQWFNSSAAWIGPDRFTGNKVRVSVGGYAPEEATHWMPLPQPPGTKRAEENAQENFSDNG